MSYPKYIVNSSNGNAFVALKTDGSVVSSPPTNVSTSNTTYNSSTINWTNGQNETQWNLEYGISGFTKGQGQIININTKPYTLTGLTQNTLYDIYLQTICDQNNISTWTQKTTFSTTLCIDCVKYAAIKRNNSSTNKILQYLYGRTNNYYEFVENNTNLDSFNQVIISATTNKFNGYIITQDDNTGIRYLYNFNPYTFEIGSQITQLISTTGDTLPISITTDNNDNLYILYKEGSITKYNIQTNTSTLVMEGLGTMYASGITYDYDNNNLIYSNGISDNIIIISINLYTMNKNILFTLNRNGLNIRSAQVLLYIGNNIIQVTQKNAVGLTSNILYKFTTTNNICQLIQYPFNSTNNIAALIPLYNNTANIITSFNMKGQLYDDLYNLNLINPIETQTIVRNALYNIYNIDTSIIIINSLQFNSIDVDSNAVGNFAPSNFEIYMNDSTNIVNSFVDSANQSGLNGGNYTDQDLTLLAVNSNGEVTDIDGTINSFTCFAAGSIVETDQGNIKIENINKNNHTINGNKIIAITKTKLIGKEIVTIEKDALAENIPLQKTFVSPTHMILYNNDMKQAKWIAENNNINGAYFSPYNNETLYNILMEEYGLMKVNNMITETLHPNNLIAKIYTQYNICERNEIINKFNKSINKKGYEITKKLFNKKFSNNKKNNKKQKK